MSRWLWWAAKWLLIVWGVGFAAITLVSLLLDWLVFGRDLNGKRPR